MTICYYWSGTLTITKVDEMKRLGITAVALDVETIDTASLEGQDLLREVGECKWAVVIISPERLTSPAFDDILRSADFRANLALYVVDEAHIVIPWSLTFRKSYGQLGKVQARIRSGALSPIVLSSHCPFPGTAANGVISVTGLGSW